MAERKTPIVSKAPAAIACAIDTASSWVRLPLGSSDKSR